MPHFISNMHKKLLQGYNLIEILSHSLGSLLSIKLEASDVKVIWQNCNFYFVNENIKWNTVNGIMHGNSLKP